MMANYSKDANTWLIFKYTVMFDKAKIEDGHQEFFALTCPWKSKTVKKEALEASTNPRPVHKLNFPHSCLTNFRNDKNEL